MSEGEKLHQLLEFMVQTGQTAYEYDELIPAFKYGVFKKPNAKEIERLCSVLIFDGLVLNAPGPKSGGISVKPQAIEAYYGKKYFEVKEKVSYSSIAVLGATVIGSALVGGFGWLGYISHDRGEKLKNAEQRIQTASELDQKRLSQIDSLSASKNSLSTKKDSLQKLVNNLRSEIEILKTPAPKKPAKAKQKRK